ncbi:hypothetical protein [Actinoallomurus sp. NPDC050550]|uniref:hypothetical protein n=1 Tax=Actinoallomurus sp. NPDC050550 TaxID=3154937 RepID=UPI0033D2B41A
MTRTILAGAALATVIIGAAAPAYAATQTRVRPQPNVSRAEIARLAIADFFTETPDRLGRVPNEDEGTTAARAGRAHSAITAAFIRAGTAATHADSFATLP